MYFIVYSENKTVFSESYRSDHLVLTSKIEVEAAKKMKNPGYTKKERRETHIVHPNKNNGQRRLIIKNYKRSSRVAWNFTGSGDM